MPRAGGGEPSSWNSGIATRMRAVAARALAVVVRAIRPSAAAAYRRIAAIVTGRTGARASRSATPRLRRRRTLDNLRASTTRRFAAGGETVAPQPEAEVLEAARSGRRGQRAAAQHSLRGASSSHEKIARGGPDR